MSGDMTPVEFRDGLLALMDNSISGEEFARLEQTIATNAALRNYYYDFMLVHASLRNRTSHASVLTEVQSEDVRDATLWQALGEYERKVEPLEVPMATQKPELIRGVRDLKKQLATNVRSPRLSLYTALVGLAALFAVICYVLMMPRFTPVPVATLMDAYHAQWADRAPEIGERLTNEQVPLTLLSGCVKVRFDNNAEVIIEGPSQFCLLNAEQMRITQGKLNAVVPPMAAGFRVDTPIMSVLDFGTEFSVKVGRDGIGTVSMYEGKASMLAGEAGTRRGSEMLTAGQARRINSITGQVDEIAPETDFVRRLHSKDDFVWRGEPISLASLIAGGNGFDPVLDFRIINPGTGDYEKKVLKSQDIRTNYAYNPVADNSFIDGVFIPDGDQGDVVISSKGHRIEAPATSGLCTYDIAVFFKRFETSESQAMGPLFDGILQWTQTQPSVLLHSNIGITIDLQEIRQRHPGMELASLQTGYGCSWADRRGFVDFTVLVDGVIKHEHKELKSRTDSYAISVDLEEQSRFLTFVVTDSPRPGQDAAMAHEYDFFYLLNPVLNLK